MRLSVVTGLLACTLIIGISSSKAGAISVEDLQNTKTVGSSSELLVYVDKNNLIEDNSGLKDLSVPAQSAEVKHVVVEDETLSKIADDYKTSWKRIYDKNIAIVDPNIVNPGDEMIIPDVDEVISERPLPVATVNPIIRTNVPRAKKLQSQSIASSVTARQTSRGSTDGNRYVAGYCTWYVKNVRQDMPNNLGNAISWVSRAAAQGMATGSTPNAGAVGQRGNHVVYVESVNGDGTMTISEMNHKGLYVKTVRTISPAGWSFIY